MQVVLPSLHHDFGNHLGVNGAEVAVGARLGEGVSESPRRVSSTFDLKALSSLTTVWGISSRFVHRTVVPTGIVIVAGEKLKLSILIATSDEGFAGGVAARVLVPGPAVKYRQHDCYCSTSMSWFSL